MFPSLVATSDNCSKPFSDDPIRRLIDMYGIDKQRLRRPIEYVRKVVHVDAAIARSLINHLESDIPAWFELLDRLGKSDFGADWIFAQQ